MSRSWAIADLLDLEYLLGLDGLPVDAAGAERITRRDRDLFLAACAGEGERRSKPAADRMVEAWLAGRRLHLAKERGEPLCLPGTVWRELDRVSRWGALAAGLMAGVGLAASFLAYTGKAPLNVSSFFAMFVLLQLFILGGQAAFVVSRRLRGGRAGSSLAGALVGRLLLRLADRAGRRLERNLTGGQRLDLAALLGAMQQRREYAPLLVLTVFLLLQLGGIGFNLGVLGMMMARVVFSDIAFGWQSTLQLTPDLLAGLVQFIALPWSWAVPPHLAFPGIEQIAGSQMVLKEGMYHLATRDLISWWPFLCLSVAAYGLLPRGVLFLLAGWVQRRMLRRLTFTGSAVRQLLQRMEAPLLRTCGEPEQAGGRAPAVASGESPFAGGEGGSSLGRPGGGETRLVLVPDELLAACDRKELRDLLHARGCDGRTEIVPFDLLDQVPMERVAALTGQGGGDIVLLQEAWQPPLEETCLFLRHLRQAAGGAGRLTLLLVGRPTTRTPLTPVSADDLHVWTRTVQALGDPRLNLLPLLPS